MNRKGRGEMMQKILIVEDDPIIKEQLNTTLSQWQYEVECVEEFDQVVEHFTKAQPHLVIMDISLPYFNGFYWNQQIRQLSNVPILMLSSHDQPSDIVMSLNMGADDYLTKPFDMNVLIAKIQSILRRTYELGQEVSERVFNNVSLSVTEPKLTFQEQEVMLTHNEWLILLALFEQNGKIVSREALMNQLWQSDLFIDDNTLTVNIARLRKKLQEINLEQFIITKKGLGYGLGRSE